MDNPNSYLDKAEHNEDFVEDIQETLSGYEDWVVTARFYTAVQYVDEILDQNGVSVENHTERFKKVEQEPWFSKRGYTLYNSLWNLSIKSRYKCVEISPGQVNSSQLALEKLKRELGFS